MQQTIFSYAIFEGILRVKLMTIRIKFEKLPNPHNIFYLVAEKPSGSW